MLFKMNCERCEDLLVKGKVYNYRGKNLCEDCYILHYIFGRETSNDFSPDVRQPRRGSEAVVLQLLTKR